MHDVTRILSQIERGNGNPRHAFYWAGDTSDAVSLGSLGSSTDLPSWGLGLNGFGEIVGQSFITADNTPADDSLATLWTRSDNKMIALETQIPSKPSWNLTWAADVNDSGWIVRFGGKSNRGSVTWSGIILVPTGN